MATRGHVQDPNDRRLRPIYVEMGFHRVSQDGLDILTS
ncbi:NAA25 isoform 4 [Pongo abelii]|uniref:NAA25 isoform 4 n=1 Tax=Pongo abelii TaxID=9601 RepID=A0A2J8XKV0_PONAB|nr:NAA25 isoform 4 [Pongo abelii]